MVVYEIKVKMTSAWVRCAKTMGPYSILYALEAAYPHREFVAIPFFETKYVCE